MKKTTAIAPSNIACIKYWGKADDALRIPLNSSISMNLSGAYTTTTVEFSTAYTSDEIFYIAPSISSKPTLPREFGYEERKRVVEHLDRIREFAHTDTRAKVVTRNTFPKGAGAASSASGFAALTLAGFQAAGVSLSQKELTVFARVASGSACRSIPDGFVFWEKGTSSDTSYAYSLHPHDYWDLRDILVIVDVHMKKVSTSEGMESVATSPLLKERIKQLPFRIEKMKCALREKNFVLFGETTEEDCLDMHALMQTQDPPLRYWNEMTKTIIDAVRGLRNSGLPVYFTIDAGPNVHVICEGKNEKTVLEEIKRISGVLQIISNKSAPGAHVIDHHLF